MSIEREKWESSQENKPDKDLSNYEILSRIRERLTLDKKIYSLAAEARELSEEGILEVEENIKRDRYYWRAGNETYLALIVNRVQNFNDRFNPGKFEISGCVWFGYDKEGNVAHRVHKTMSAEGDEESVAGETKWGYYNDGSLKSRIETEERIGYDYIEREEHYNEEGKLTNKETRRREGRQGDLHIRTREEIEYLETGEIKENLEYFNEQGKKIISSERHILPDGNYQKIETIYVPESGIKYSESVDVFDREKGVTETGPKTFFNENGEPISSDNDNLIFLEQKRKAS